ncbi:MAG: phospholipase D-like domain-containing protein [Candidatus Bathyarchaeia archaeon]
MRESIDLIDEIWKIYPYSRILFTTYKYNQYFFEKHIFPHFRGKSCPLLLIDYNEYQNSLREGGISKLAGIRYLVESVKIPSGTFHPKMIFACSKKEIKLIVSSANLTHAGFSKNAEICSVETIPFERRNDFPILCQTVDFLSRLQRYILSKPHKQAVEGILNRIDLKEQPGDVKISNPCLLHNLKQSILEQIREIIQADVERMTVVSPFFSQDLSLYEKVAHDFTDNIEFIIQPNNHDLPAKKLENWSLLPKLSFSALKFKDNRFLHGKMILFQTKSNVFALTGSMNFTEKALLLSAENGGNVEVALLKCAPLKYFDYMFSQDSLTLEKIDLKETNPVAYSPPFLACNDFCILEANIVGGKLVILFDYLPTEGALKVRVHIDKLEKEFCMETNSNLIMVDLSFEELQMLTTSSIVSLVLEDNGKKLSSDLRLIHNPLYFPEQFSALSTVIDEDERVWLFKILNRYANLPSFNYVLPLIERMENYGFFELKPIDKEELLWKWQSKIVKIKPYSTEDQIVQLIDRFRQRHEKRMKAAIQLKKHDWLQTVIDSFIMVNKLVIWLVRKGLQDISYLRFIRTNVEKMCNNEFIDLTDQKEVQIIREKKLLAYLVMFSHVVDYYQRTTPEFVKLVTPAGRNPLKDAFEETFVLAIQFLRKISENELISGLKSLTSEFEDLAPEIDFSISMIISRLNQIIQNVNSNPYKKYSFSLL